MTHKLNCWEFNNCGREPDGILADQLGVCPIAVEMKRDGDNGGMAAGRVCWTVPIADEHGRTLKSCADKACLQCAFFKRVRFEEKAPKEFKRTIILAGESSIKKKTYATEEVDVA